MSIPISFFVFVAFAALTVLGGCGVAFFRNIVHSAFSLLASFAGMVGLFAFMSADFLAVVQLMVYVGGILVLILFAVMLTSRISDVGHSNPSSNIVLGLCLLAATLGGLIYTVRRYEWTTRDPSDFQPTAETIGNAFLGPYLLPFEVAGLLLLAALLAAVVIARKDVKAVDEGAVGPAGGQP